MRKAWAGGLVGLIAGLLLHPALGQDVNGQAPATTAPGQPTFRSGVSLVSVSAVVKDERGRPVRNLTRDDFQVLENGSDRPIVDFGYSDQGPVSFGVLIDQSGSMSLAQNLDGARDVIRHLLAWFDPVNDEVALFAFDRQLSEVQGFTNVASVVTDALPRLHAFGTTALYDAIASTAQRLETRPNKRRAVLVVTDGLDTASTKTARDVSGIASAIDVPVYVVVVMSPLNHPDRGGPQLRANGDDVTTNLANLAYWTGGDMLIASTPAETSQAARQMVVDLRHQYLLAFESSTRSGWHQVHVRTRKPNLQVRARSGYMAQTSSSAGA